MKKTTCAQITQVDPLPSTVADLPRDVQRLHMVLYRLLHLPQVAGNETAISAFNRFLAEQRRPPKSANELKSWFSNGGK